jgi:hypothetical protein
MDTEQVHEWRAAVVASRGRQAVLVRAAAASVVLVGAFVGALAPGASATACPDAALEGDNTPADARPFPLGSAVRRAFCTAGDQDWYYFDASSATGVGYYVELAARGGEPYTTVDYPGPGIEEGLSPYFQVFVDELATGGPVRISLGFRDWTDAAGPDRVYDVRVRRVAPRNLLVNGGFELDANGDSRPDGWTSDPRFTRAARPFRGSYSGRLTGSGDYWITQKVSGLRPDRLYRFSGRVFVPATTDSFEVKLFEVQRDASGQRSGMLGPFAIVSGPTGGWKTATWGGAISPAEGSATATLQLRAFGLDTARVFIDDVVYGEYEPAVEPPPPPGT